MSKKLLPKGFLFDFDGVVVESVASHHAAWNSAFNSLFGQDLPVFPKELAGKSPMLIAQYYCGTIGKEDQTKDLYLLKDTHLDVFFKTPTLLPGIQEITQFLDQEAIPFGIASNATRQFLKNSIHHLNLNFTTYFGVQDYKKPKPAPEAYITLAKALGFEKKDFNDIWVFEDSLTGTTAAKAAGMIPIGILTQYSEKELKNAGSQLVFPTVLEAYQYLVN
ncbi:HAD family phosphatase [Polaribacter sp. WD7]|uniref:HAD family hydrolase n=1 Tax=Polaribacter sp. WD7 TaxID=2269061 RepID=UPI000DF20FF7|nr:HAD family phosphatase [Polaribacter sp. WD7]RCS28268.1 HAD family phosphatase [Polaribacter sp. WD7]